MPSARTVLNDRRRLACALACLSVCVSAAGADRAPTGEQVRLIAERAAVAPGAPFTLAVELKTRPGWHTYWLNPGDSGLAPTLNWRLPEGVRLVHVAFPAPDRIEEEGLVSLGYTNQVWLLADFATDAKLADAQRLEVGVSVDWMVCRDVCLPLKGGDAVRLNVDEVSAVQATAVSEAEFSRWRAKVPQPADGWAVRAQLERRGLRLRVQPASGAGPTAAAWGRAQFYPIRRGVLDLQAAQRWRPDGAAWEVLLRVGPEPFQADDMLNGILVFPAETGDRAAIPCAWSLRAAVAGRP